jgi:hypothetical protein
VLAVEDAALYQALHRLECEAVDRVRMWGCLTIPGREILRANSAGRRQLRMRTSVWKRYANAVFKVLETP